LIFIAFLAVLLYDDFVGGIICVTGIIHADAAGSVLGDLLCGLY
jgi:hypothetical protein